MHPEQSPVSGELLWQMSTRCKIENGSIAAFMGGAAAFWGISCIVYGYYLLSAAVLVTGAASATFFGLRLRSSVLLTPLALVVRTPARMVELPLPQVVSVIGTRNGLVVSASDGRRIMAPAAAWSHRSPRNQELRVTYRASDAATVISNAVKAAGAQTAE